ncbi:NAD(P)H-dependent oxidoreductase [Leucobacter sp. CSA1]|uniref:NAD(P)H-dependent oxidoreductase n=1 Tax=Leucobacter chromiisoli TaxID=2796471 RepID=A0A934UW93_9MICO|nr:CE1759 family FMN reductase [Leucobacter chromiisoli]MBK0419687.1 NAD(P)H-dependent oxidoreductase [Leucobacter chromiisoli]
MTEVQALEAPRVRLVAVSGGLGSPSSSRLLVDRVVAHAERALLAHGVQAETEVIELRDLAVPIANNLVTGFAEPGLAGALSSLEHADGVIAVSPVFNASVAGLFKSFFDLVGVDALGGVPVALGATGGSARHSLVIEYAMRPLFSYLRALPMPTGVFAATEDWGAGAAGSGIEERAARVARELADAVRAGLAPVPTVDPVAGPPAVDPVAGSPAVDPATGSTAIASPAAPVVGSTATPPIAATAADFTPEARAARERREEHDDFAELMSRFAGTEVG